MEQHQSILQNNNNNNNNLIDNDFQDAPDQFPFPISPNSFQESDQSASVSVSSSEPNNTKDQESTITVISDHTPDSPSSPSSAGLRHRRLTSPRSCKESSKSQFFKNNPDGLIDFDPHSTFKRRVFKDHEKLNHILDTGSSSVITSDESSTADSPNSAPDLVSILTELVIKVVSYQTQFLTNSVTFPLWLLHSVYLVMTDPLGLIEVAKSYMLGNASSIWGIWFSVVKLVNHLGLQKHESTVKLCYRIGWGLLWFAYCVFFLVSLLVPAFVFGGVMVRWIVEEPVRMTEKLVFDYTEDTPTAFVPVISCPESSVLASDKIGGSFGESRVIPFYHEVHATVSLTLPESDYNLNLGVFQVRVDFLSGDGKPLASIRQPCMLQFRSQPIRLVSTFFKLASLLAGYSSETQTLDVKFRGYTEKDVHTSCSRVVIEQRAEFAKRGGVPEIYSASLKIESQLPFVRRMLWYSKWLIYLWISIMMYIMELLFTLLFCRSVVFPWERSVGGSGSSSHDASHNKPSGLN